MSMCDCDRPAHSQVMFCNKIGTYLKALASRRQNVLVLCRSPRQAVIDSEMMASKEFQSKTLTGREDPYFMPV